MKRKLSKTQKQKERTRSQHFNIECPIITGPQWRKRKKVAAVTSPSQPRKMCADIDSRRSRARTKEGCSQADNDDGTTLRYGGDYTRAGVTNLFTVETETATVKYVAE